MKAEDEEKEEDMKKKKINTQITLLSSNIVSRYGDRKQGVCHLFARLLASTNSLHLRPSSMRDCRFSAIYGNSVSG